MTNQTLIRILEQHGIEYVDNGSTVNAKDEYTINGVLGFNWKCFSEHCTINDLLCWLGY